MASDSNTQSSEQMPVASCELRLEYLVDGLRGAEK
jgi:hypothetical protein